MVEVKENLEDRSVALAEGLRFMHKRVFGGGLVDEVKDYQCLQNLDTSDFGLELATIYGQSTEPFVKTLMNEQAHYINLASKFPEILNAMSGYVDRLKELSERDDSLEDLYIEFFEIFGGQTQ